MEAMETIEKFVEGIDFDNFQKNDMVSSAVIRKFEIIGEAAKKVGKSNRPSGDSVLTSQRSLGEEGRRWL